MLTALLLALQLALPNPAITPGAVLTTNTAKVCSHGYSKRVRHVTKQDKIRTFRLYKITPKDQKNYKIDHLIPLELGGANSSKNRWPQPNKEANLKDKLENKLHKLVCSNKANLVEVQKQISTDWTKMK